MKVNHSCSGFSLVEIMVSMAIGMVIILAVSQVFLSNRTTYRQAEAIARLQENGRFVLDALGFDIRMAGAIGCKKDENPSTNGDSYPSNIATPSGSDFLVLNRGITGYKAGIGGAPSGFAWSETTNGSSVIAIKYADSAIARVDANMASPSGSVTLDGNPVGFEANEVLVISDCQFANVFAAGTVSDGLMAPGTAVTLTHNATNNTSANFSSAYKAGAEVSRLVSRIYYVGNGTGGCSANTLCRKNLTLVGGAPSMKTEEIIPGVESFDLMYGVADSNPSGSANKFVDATGVTNWNLVDSVQVNLLSQSKDNDLVVKGPATYWYKGQSGTAAAATDRRLRRGFTQTFTVRNANVY